MTATRDPRQRNTGGAAALAGLVIGSLLLAALLAPAGHALLGLAGIEVPFSRVFGRTAIAVALVLAVLLRRHIPLGLVRDAWLREGWHQRLRSAAVGVAAASLPAVAALPLVVASSRLDWAGRPASAWAAALLAAIPGALVVSLAEESFFRVLLFRGFGRSLPTAVAAISSSAVYAVVHFLTPALPVEIDARQPLAGLEYLGWVATTLVSTEVLPAVVGLFLVGLVLCATLHRTGSLALCVGLHAGWFAATKVAIRATTLGPAMLAAGSLPKRLLMIGSPWVWLATLLTGVAVWLAATRLRPRSAQAASGA